MGIVLVRVDQRLVHGIVVTQVTKSVNAKRIMVIDDQISQDENQKAIMRMSKPAGTGMSIISVETAVQNILAGKYEDHNVLVVVRDISVIVKLVERGVFLPKIQLGIIFEREDRERFTKSVSLNPQEQLELQALSLEGIPIIFQLTPTDKEEAFDKYVKK
ncbi:TPA: PTS sugar transporter subunit IIB [Streptococcus suis]|uniref:PTS sugar transporter subunit IIB n=1 Tax=Streptococcus suis TaxID=1307 RepID=UPI002A7D20B0|nr:PTS sugar transporter subunit IIB [Streptococcus suis]MDY7599573.1 PTS sugar transporter subunit IIB [Streptococcus suis]HEL1893966.1 PTS sugar transporter subunit IIB [Streptococcus suis]HEL2216652.1 PTS sugar transporter subunit IIB [Streptococcus suis]HEL2480371.1 PTS sugar transporter subunit IIB [Streptococcus suis]HEL2598836.1 PTS sugar transporter subunit IIB [Streptococcus suis]